MTVTAASGAPTAGTLPGPVQSPAATQGWAVDPPPAVQRIQARLTALSSLSSAGPASFADSLDQVLSSPSLASDASSGSPSGTWGGPGLSGSIGSGSDPMASGGLVTAASLGYLPGQGVVAGSGGVGSLALLGALGTGTGATGSSLGAQAVSEARSFVGVPYQWGGESPTTGFDCSGLVQYVYSQLGVALPRTSEEQANAGVAVPSLAQAQPGDLLFFEPGASGPGHVGIYIGGGQMIDAPHTGSEVRVEPVWGTPVAIRRVTGATTAAIDAAAAIGGTGVIGGAGVIGGTAAAGATGGAQPPGWAMPMIASAAASSGVPATLLAGLLQTESGFDPYAVSPAGAQGIAQLMPSTAASLGVNPFDPAEAIGAAANTLAGYHQQFGSWDLALAAYNAGPAAVQRYGGVPPYAETQAYVAKINALAGTS